MNKSHKSQKKKKKPFQDLEFSDAFMFAVVMEDEEICRSLLERILEIPIKAVKVDSEKALVWNPNHRSVRLDVYADDEQGTMFNVEMQNKKKKHLPKRSRLYQSQMDVASIEPGEDFGSLPNSFVIFICTFDPFGDGFYRYRFKETCIENGKILKTGTQKVFLNTKGKNPKGVTQELIQFLKYVENMEPFTDQKDSLLNQIENRIIKIKQNRRMEGKYMLFGEMLDDERREGRREGRGEGKNMERRIWMSLVSIITPEDFRILQSNPSKLQEFLEKYHIDNSNSNQ